MKQKIRPAEEEIGNVAFIFLFLILWYSALLGSVMSGGAGITVILFFVAGLLPVYSAVTMIRRALFYRKQRADAIAYGQSQPGRIQGVVRQDVPYHSGKNRTLRYHRYYYLKVDITDPVTGVTNTIQSQDIASRFIAILLRNRCASIPTGAAGNIIWKTFGLRSE